VRLLFVCTGNVCRSPLAERLALAWARQSLGAGVAGLEVRSAGLRAPVGRPMDPHSAAVLTRLDGDPTGARATAFDPAVAERADLVLTMTRAHRHSVLESVPHRLRRRTFTLLEAADLMTGVDLGVGSARPRAPARRLTPPPSSEVLATFEPIVYFEDSSVH
jgi:protein-tyrosine phosphatase